MIRNALTLCALLLLATCTGCGSSNSENANPVATKPAATAPPGADTNVSAAQKAGAEAAQQNPNLGR